MTYQEAIERARECAKRAHINCIVFSYKKHWWSKLKYDYDTTDLFECLVFPNSIKLLTITPDGTIAQ